MGLETHNFFLIIFFGQIRESESESNCLFFQNFIPCYGVQVNAFYFPNNFMVSAMSKSTTKSSGVFPLAVIITRKCIDGLHTFEWYGMHFK